MQRDHPQRAAERATLAATVGAGLLACVLIVGCLWSCARKQPPPPTRGPLSFTGVPVVRVLLTSKAIETVAAATAGGYRLCGDGNVAHASDSSMQQVVVTRSGATWRFGVVVVQARQVSLQPSGDGGVRAGETAYRGNLHFLPAGQRQFLIVNHLDLESYLAGVLAKELYPSWHGQTYRAQAVAARTFAMHHMLRFGRSQEYDLGCTQAWQVYGGLSGETEKAWEAVRATRGQVLACGNEGDERIFMAQYSACCGGQVNAAKVIRQAADIEPLRGGQVCTDCASCPRYRWKPVRIAKADLHRALAQYCGPAAKLAGVEALRVVEAGPRGRAVWVDVVGPDNKTLRLRAEEVRLALLHASASGADKLYSMNCRFRDLGDAIEFYDGSGFGHGVGLCQWGAQAKAARGATAEQILAFYYPGAKIFRAY